MSVTITIQDSTGKVIGSFPAEDNKSISQLAEKNGIEIPVSCCQGACYICACKIKKGNKYIQIDKLSPPLASLERNEAGEFTEVFACIGGIYSEYLKDTEQHEVVLEKTV